MTLLVLAPAVDAAGSSSRSDLLGMDVGTADLSLPEAGPTRTHRGVLMVGSSSSDADNELFFTRISQALDKRANLPNWIRRDVNRIRTIVYNPPSPERAEGTFDRGLPHAVFVRKAGYGQGRGVLLVQGRTHNLTSSGFVMAMVSSSIYALRMAERLAISDIAQENRLTRCQRLIRLHRAAGHLGFKNSKVARFSRAIRVAGCA